tara:strand:+ start:99 stop:326 length:228 start_codon:yes stop_codon:yes gene_type:complete
MKELGHGVTMEEVQEVFFKGSSEDMLERAASILEDTKNQHKRGSKTLDVCFNLEILLLMVNEIKRRKGMKNEYFE